MANHKLVLSIFFISVFIFLSGNAVAQLKADSNGNVHVDYEASSGTSLMFGPGTNGAWAMEYADGGLNFWRPYPLSSYGNYKLFLKDDGRIGVNKIPEGQGKIEIEASGTSSGIYINNGYESDMRIFRSGNYAYFTRGYHSTSTHINYGSTYRGIIMDTNGHVGIGKTPSYWLEVNGSVKFHGTVYSSSDERLKKDIKELKDNKTKKNDYWQYG